MIICLILCYLFGLVTPGIVASEEEDWNIIKKVVTARFITISKSVSAVEYNNIF